jgi:exonuclease III
MQEYYVYHFGKKPTVSHKNEGVAILIRRTLLKNITTYEYNIVQGRLAAVRLASRNIDITIITGYIPLSDDPDSYNIWQHLHKFTQQLPCRTYKIIGMDTNAHIDITRQTAHWAQANKTYKIEQNSNGQQLETFLESRRLYLANTKTTKPIVTQ